MIVGSNQANGRDTDLFVADPRKPGFQRTLMEVKNEHWNATDWSHDGKSLLLIRYVSINECYPAMMDFESGRQRDLPIPGNEKAAIGALQFAAPTASRLTSPAMPRTNSAASRVLDLASGKYEWLTSDIPWDVNGLEVDDKSGNVAFTVNADGASAALSCSSRNRVES